MILSLPQNNGPSQKTSMSDEDLRNRFHKVVHSRGGKANRCVNLRCKSIASLYEHLQEKNRQPPLCWAQQRYKETKFWNSKKKQEGLFFFSEPLGCLTLQRKVTSIFSLWELNLSHQELWVQYDEIRTTSGNVKSQADICLGMNTLPTLVQTHTDISNVGKVFTHSQAVCPVEEVSRHLLRPDEETVGGVTEGT